MKRFVVGFFAVVLLSGCASSTYFAQHSPNTRETTVYVVREHAEPIAWNINILVDGKKAASLANKSFVKFSASAGRHHWAFDWPLLAASPSVRADIDLRGGQSHYLVVTGEARVTGVYLFVFVTTQSLHVFEVPQADGEKMIQRIKK